MALAPTLLAAFADACAAAQRKGLRPALGAMLALLAWSSAFAQPAPAADPPGRVARLADASGQVWVLPADGDEWMGAVRNQPITGGDRIATEAGARAEIELGSTTLRLDGGTELEVARLDDDHLALQLQSGSVAAHLRAALDAGQFSLSTDDGRFRVLRAGRYRFDRLDNASHLTVFDGQAVYDGPNSALTVNPGQHAEFWIDANGVAQYAMSGPYNDAFAAWIGERDRVSAPQGPALQYVSPEMTGAQDLDRYGTWEQTAEYGVLWTPAVVAADWAPYRAGHWAWVAPWGWTWIDDAPWGFAPFHYGRWVHYRDRWCWAPGQRVARPVYAPALVAWVGAPGVSVSVRIGGAPGPAVGWFPLAPREVYVPAYRVSPHYVRNVNITQVTNVTVIENAWRHPEAPRDYANRRLPGALTVVPAAVMRGREPVAPAASRWRDAPWARQIAQQPPQALVRPPVVAPPAPPRVADRSTLRPPGFAPAAPGGRSNGRPDGRPDGRPGAPGAEATRPGIARPGAPGVPPQAAQPQRPSGIAAPPGIAPAPGIATPGQPPAVLQPGAQRPGLGREGGMPSRPDRAGRDGGERVIPPVPQSGSVTQRPGAVQGERPALSQVERPGAPQIGRPSVPQAERPAPPQMERPSPRSPRESGAVIQSPAQPSERPAPPAWRQPAPPAVEHRAPAGAEPRTVQRSQETPRTAAPQPRAAEAPRVQVPEMRRPESPPRVHANEAPQAPRERGGGGSGNNDRGDQPQRGRQ